MLALVTTAATHGSLFVRTATAAFALDAALAVLAAGSILFLAVLRASFRFLAFAASLAVFHVALTVLAATRGFCTRGGIMLATVLGFRSARLVMAAALGLRSRS